MSDEKNIDLNIILTTLSGEAIQVDGKDQMMAQLIANTIAKVPSKDPLRSFLLAKDVYETGLLDKKDANFVASVIKESNLSPLVVGQMLQVIEQK